MRRQLQSQTVKPRGSILIVTMGVVIALTGLALVFSREMRVEALASGNMLASAEADAIVSGATQHVFNRLAANTDRTSLDNDIQSEAVQVGDGAFWILRPNPDNENQYAYGLIDESSKLNINTASVDMLMRLPGMTQELAASIVDWRDPDDDVSEGGGAESAYYLLQPEPYYCKNAPFETLDEVMLVKGATREVLFGVDANRNGVVDADEAGTQGHVASVDGQAQCGVYKYMTVYGSVPNTSKSGQPRLFVGDVRTRTLAAISVLLSRTMTPERVATITNLLRNAPQATNVLDFYQKSKMTIDEFKGVSDLITTDNARTLSGRINVNTAPREVLRCLPGLEDSDIDALIAKRTNGGSELENIAWVTEVLTPEKAALIGGRIITRSYQYSADIVGVSGNGRCFKRLKAVFEMRTTPPRLAFCKDTTYLGWPLMASQRDQLRDRESQMNGSLGGSSFGRSR